MKTVTASEATRQFSSMLREVAQGETITVVSKGKPVATIGPARTEGADRIAARSSLVKRLSSQKVTGQREWSREELYDSE